MSQYEDFKVVGLPDSAYYIPNFIDEHQETNLLEKIYSSPKPKWKSLCNRRLQNWGGLPHPKGMVQEDLPEWLKDLTETVSSLQIFSGKTANHILINEYLPGQGIMPHEDGPLFYPTIATVNLGSHTVLDYYEKPNTDNRDEQDMQMTNNNCIGLRKLGSLLLERRSLLIVQDDLYHSYLHGIREIMCDPMDDDHLKNIQGSNHSTGTTLKRETRISLTIRYVPKTVKFKFFSKIK